MAAIKIFPSGQVHQLLPICPTLGMQSSDKKLALLQVRGGAAPSPRPGAYCRPEVRLSSVSMETTAYFVLELEVGRTVQCRYLRTLQVFTRCSVDICRQTGMYAQDGGGAVVLLTAVVLLWVRLCCVRAVSGTIVSIQHGRSRAPRCAAEPC